MLSLFTGFMQVSAHTGVQLRVLNLPFAFSGMTSFTLELEIEENAFDWSQQAFLDFQSCGQELKLLYDGEEKTDLISKIHLWSGKYYFQLELKDRIEHDCDLEFFLWDMTRENILATAGIGLKYGTCYNPIDSDQESILSGHVVLWEVWEEDPNQEHREIVFKKEYVQKEQNTQQVLNTQEINQFTRLYDWVLKQQLWGFIELSFEKFMKPLTRMELAQMIVAFGEKNQWEMDSEKRCEYQDLEMLSEAVKWTAQQVCQRDVMGIHPDLSPLENFMPDMLVTRDQMVTVISRILWGDLYNQGQTFYEKHIQQAKKIWLIEQTDPSIVELRSYFYLILYRAIEQGVLSLDQKEKIQSAADQDEQKSRWKFW